MNIKQLWKEFEDLKKDIRPDDRNLSRESFDYSVIQDYLEMGHITKDEADKQISELFKGLTDEEKAIVTIEEQPEYLEYKKAINEGNVNQAIEILKPLSERVRNRIIDDHYFSLVFFEVYVPTVTDNNASDPVDKHVDNLDKLEKRFKASDKYKWVHEVGAFYHIDLRGFWDL